MRLIHARDFALEEFFEGHAPRYAILSHTWESEEVLFHDMHDLSVAKAKRGFRKIQYACEQAKRDGLQYVWVDSCCIDKRSSSELQEAINSMFAWYSKSEHCYVYLSDLLASCPDIHRIHSMNREGYWEEDQDDKEQAYNFWKRIFCESKWFTRGWTLQELLAPPHLTFYGSGWNRIGSKYGLRYVISEATHISSEFLIHEAHLSSASVAMRMSWAANRQTTRLEDQAYSLLGLFDVNMPMLYGEGRKAFLRLQEEIIKTSSDLSIFAWTGQNSNGRLLAESPAEFAAATNVETVGKSDSLETASWGDCLAIMNCGKSDSPGELLALHIRKYAQSERYYVVPHQDNTVVSALTDSTSGRLKTVDMSVAMSAPEEAFKITKVKENYSSRVKLTFRLAEEASYETPAVLEHCYPSPYIQLQDRKTLVIPLQVRQVIKAGVVLRYGRGHFFVVFGAFLGDLTLRNFDRSPGIYVSYYSDSEWDAMEGHLTGSATTGSLVESWVPCRHGLDCVDDSGYRCPNMQRRFRAWDSAGSVALTATIGLKEIFGELICDVVASFGKLSDALDQSLLTVVSR